MTNRPPDEAFYNSNPHPSNFNQQMFGYNNDQSRHFENQYGDHFTDFLDSIKHQDYATFSQLLRDNPGLATRIDTITKQPAMFYVVQISNEDLALQMIRDLMDRGADPRFKDPLRQNPMSYIARDGKVKIFDFLAGMGVPSNEIDANQQTPLYYASREGRFDICKRILDLGADPNHTDLNGQTCLFYAAKTGQLEVCKLLVDYGIKHDHADFKKQTALAWAKKSKNQALVDYLQSLKAGHRVQKERPEPKAAPQKKKGPKIAKEEPRITYKLVFLNPGGSRLDVTLQDFERFRQTHPELADYLMHPEKIPPEDNEKKKEKWEKVAKKMMQTLWKYKDSYIFHEPVDPVKLNCFDYFRIIKNPMDFGTIRTRLNSGHYRKFQEFLDDVTLVFKNCIMYNGTGSIVGKLGLSVEGEFLKLCRDFNVEQLLQEDMRDEHKSEFAEHESMQSFPHDLLDDDFAAHDMFNLDGSGN